MNYKGWQLYIDHIETNFHHRIFVVCARLFRVLLTPELEKPIPYLGRMTRIENIPFTCEYSCLSLREGLTYLKNFIDEAGKVEWIIVNDQWKKDK